MNQTNVEELWDLALEALDPVIAMDELTSSYDYGIGTKHLDLSGLWLDVLLISDSNVLKESLIRSAICDHFNLDLTIKDDALLCNLTFTSEVIYKVKKIIIISVCIIVVR